MQYFNPAWTNCSIPLAIFRLLCQFANYLDVTILPLYTPSEEERRDPALYASNMRKHMAGALGVPMVEQVRTPAVYCGIHTLSEFHNVLSIC